MLRLLGMAAEDDGEYLQAIRLYRFLEQLGGKEADYVRLSELFLKMKRYDKAYQELKKIKEPSEETAEVITELSQFIQNEE
jgi:tetratricopeptide (TPR) repeat protein